MKVIEAHKKWIAAIVCGLCLVVAAVGVAQRPEPGSQQEAKEVSRAFRDVAKHALPSIVSITTEGKPVQMQTDFPFDDENSPFGEFFRDRPEFRDMLKRQQRRMPTPHGRGSGVIIDASGIIMTNNHVVRDAEKVTVKLSDGREYTATDIKTDRRSDLAIVHIKGADNLQALKLGNSDAMEIGDWVLAVGSPFGLDLSVTAGIISAKGRAPGINVSEDYLQTDAAINPGNSGGPLLNLAGEIVGINTAISTQSGGYDGIGFAIPSNMAKWISGQLMEKGTVSRAFLGVAIQPLDADLAARFGTQPGHGALVTSVVKDSTAADAGLKPGDVIVEVNGQTIDGLRELRLITEKLAIGDKYSLTYLRDGKKEKIDVTAKAMPEEIANLEERPANKEKEPEKQSEKFDDLGLQTQELTPELAKKLGAEGKTGVLISAVQPDSPAERAGLDAGEIIQQVDGVDVTTPDDFHKAMQKDRKDKGVLLLVITSGGPKFVVVQPK